MKSLTAVLDDKRNLFGAVIWTLHDDTHGNTKGLHAIVQLGNRRCKVGCVAKGRLLVTNCWTSASHFVVFFFLRFWWSVPTRKFFCFWFFQTKFSLSYVLKLGWLSPIVTWLKEPNAKDQKVVLFVSVLCNLTNAVVYSLNQVDLPCYTEQQFHTRTTELWTWTIQYQQKFFLHTKKIWHEVTTTEGATIIAHIDFKSTCTIAT